MNQQELLDLSRIKHRMYLALFLGMLWVLALSVGQAYIAVSVVENRRLIVDNYNQREVDHANQEQRHQETHRLLRQILDKLATLGR